MNICYCGYQPGDHSHRPACPYPLFRGSETDEQKWMDAEAAKRAEMRAAAGRPDDEQEQESDSWHGREPAARLRTSDL